MLRGNKDDIQQLQEVFEKLTHIGCCKLCSLRFMGVVEPESYKNVSNYLLKLKNLEDTKKETKKDIKHQKVNPCIVCLGLLQKPTSDEILQMVLKEIKFRDYDSDTFNVAITLPVIFQLRAHSLWIFMQKNFPAFTNSTFTIGCVTVGVKDVWKWLFNSVIESETKKDFDMDSDLFIGISVIYEDNEKECSCLYDMVPELFNKKGGRRRKDRVSFSRKGVDQAFKIITDSSFADYFSVPPNIPLNHVTCGTVSFQHNSIFIAGRYNKWSRKLPQTPWIIGGERKMDDSVQEFICEPLEKMTFCEGSKFGASGREDVDVRMLGRGRPFSVELINPRRTKLNKQSFKALQESINKKGKEKIAVHDLQLVNKESLLHLKVGEEKETKVYSAFCVIFGCLPAGYEELSKKFPLELEQKTPIRVLHRRPVATRRKTLHSLEIMKMHDSQNPKGPSYFKLKIKTQAGTYIKEFIHGDFGRTKPSLGDLLGNLDVDILALDVQEVSLDWPPPTE